jgi:hypothetical protein
MANLKDETNCLAVLFIRMHSLIKSTLTVNSFCYLLLTLRDFGYVHRGSSGSVVGTATAYGLDGPGIESRWGRDFPHLSKPALRPTHLPVQWVPGLSRGYVVAGA